MLLIITNNLATNVLEVSQVSHRSDSVVNSQPKRPIMACPYPLARSPEVKGERCTTLEQRCGHAVHTLLLLVIKRVQSVTCPNLCYVIQLDKYDLVHMIDVECLIFI